MQTTKQSTFKITPPIRQEIIKIIDARIKEAHVTKEDFSELKNIVRDLAAAQKRTEIKVEELAEAQKRTELRLEELAIAQKELAEAQKRTEIAVTKLTEKVGELTKRADTIDTKLGGLDRSSGYAFENEAYQHLPEILKRKHGIEVKEKFIRAHIGGKEINLFCPAIKDGREVLVVGEARTTLDERRE